MRFRSVFLGAVFVLALATAGTFFWLAATVASPRVSTATASTNIAVVRQFYAAVNRVLRTGDTGDLEHVVASDLVEHAVPRGLPPTRDGLEADLNALRATWPGIQLQLDQVVAQDDLVIARARVLGTGSGTFLGLPLPAPAVAWAPGTSSDSLVARSSSIGVILSGLPSSSHGSRHGSTGGCPPGRSSRCSGSRMTWRRVAAGARIWARNCSMWKPALS